MPNQRFLLQVWDKNLNLCIGYLGDAFNITVDEELNLSNVLKFQVPATSRNTSLLVYRNCVRLIDTELPIYETSISSVVSVEDKIVRFTSSDSFSEGDCVLIYNSVVQPTKSFVARILDIDTATTNITLSRLDFEPTGGYVVLWTGITYRIWEISQDRSGDGVASLSITAQHISYDLNDRYFVLDARSDVAFALASSQNVHDGMVTPERILDEIVKLEPQSNSDFSNGFIKGSVDSFLTSATRVSLDGVTSGLAVSAGSRSVVGTGTSFITTARRGTRINMSSTGSSVGIVDYVVDDTHLMLINMAPFTVLPSYPISMDTDPDKRTFQFSVGAKLRAAVLQIAEIWSDENQDVHIFFNEDKSIDILRVPYPNPNDPTTNAEIRIRKNLVSTRRQLDVSHFGNSVYATGATSAWENSSSGQFFTIGPDPATFAFQRNSADKFLLSDRKRIRELRWGDPITVMHSPLICDVLRFEDDRTIIVDAVNMTAISLSKVSGGSLFAKTYYYRVSAIVNGSEIPAGAESSITITAGDVSGGVRTVRISWSAVIGATAYRVYGRASGAQTSYAQTASTSFDDTGLNLTLSGSPKDFEGASFTNGALLVYDIAGDATEGIGQLKTIESVAPVNLALLTLRVRVTTPYEVLPSALYRVAISTPANTFITSITGFGVLESTADTFTASTASAAEKYRGNLTNLVVDNGGTTTIGLTSAGVGVDIFKDHYANGIIQLQDGMASTSRPDQEKFQGSPLQILQNDRANNALDVGDVANNLTLKFTQVALSNNGKPRYQINGPSQLVMEFSDEDWAITATPTNDGAIAGIVLTITGATVFTSSASGTDYDAANHTVKDGSTTSDLTVILAGMEIWSGGSFVGLVSTVDFVNRLIYTTGDFVTTPADGTPFTVTEASPDFHHASDGNMFSLVPHRDDNGAHNTTPYQGFCMIADATYLVNGQTTTWGSGADSSEQFGIGHGLAISNSGTYGAGATALSANQLLLRWDAVDTGQTYTIKRLLLVRPNKYLWVSTPPSDRFKYQENDIVVLMNAETGGALTIGKSLNGKSYVDWVDTITTAGTFERIGLTKRAIPVKAGEGARFREGSRVFIGAREVPSAIYFTTRRGDQSQGQIAEVASVVMGADLSPARGFDLLKLKNDLEVLPQAGDRVELLTVQDANSIATYGRVEIREDRSDVVDPVELTRIARTTLRSSKEPTARYDISAVDFQFIDPSGRYRYEELLLGGTVRVIDDDFGLDASNFKLIKRTRNYDDPSQTRIALENYIKTLGRGFFFTASKRLAKLEQSQRVISAQLDAPKCVFFDSVNRRCAKPSAPNIFCNTSDSNRDGRLTSVKRRITTADCRSYTPSDNALMRDKVEFVEPLDFTLTNAHVAATPYEASFESVLIPNSKVADQHSFHIPEPRMVVTHAYRKDPTYDYLIFVDPSYIYYEFVRDNDDNIEPQETVYRTGVTARIWRDPAVPAGDIYCQALVLNIGRYR